MDWYEDMIEEGIRDEVRLLRDNGFNTTCSCHHDMYVQITPHIDGELKRLHDALYNAGHRDYAIELTLDVRGGHGYENVTVKFGKQPV